MIQHEKKFGVYHWDTFDNETILVKDFDTLTEAQNYVSMQYKGRIVPHGADQVDIVDDKGNVVRSYKVC